MGYSRIYDPCLGYDFCFVTHASETWILTRADRKQMNIFEYRRILGPVYDNGRGNWMILSNKEIYASVKKPTIRDHVFMTLV